MCSYVVFQERATTRHTHFIVFIRLCGSDCSRALESSRSRFLAYFIFSFYFLFSLLMLMKFNRLFPWFMSSGSSFIVARLNPVESAV